MTEKYKSNQINDPSKAPPEPGLPPIFPTVDLFQAEDERRNACTCYILKKIFFRMESMNLVHCWKVLNEQKGDLQKLFLTSEEGVVQNRASRSRFFEIINEETKNQVTLERDVLFTNIKIEDYKKVQKELTDYVDKYSMYEKFLENVAEVGENWRSVSDILNRYETLYSTSVECSRLLGEELEQAVKLRKEMGRTVEEKSEKLKALSNRLILLQVDRKDARDKRDYSEHMMQRIKNAVLDKSQEAMSLTGGMFDLYLTMCKRMHIVPMIPRADIESQIEFIHKTILFYKEVALIAMGAKTVQPLNQIRNKNATKRKRTTKTTI